jgi:hypothetical protein
MFLELLGSHKRLGQAGAYNQKSMPGKLASCRAAHNPSHGFRLPRRRDQLSTTEARKGGLYQVRALVSEGPQLPVHHPEHHHLRLMRVEHRPHFRPSAVDRQVHGEVPWRRKTAL